MVSSARPVAVIGGGVVGCAVCHALARRGVRALLLEREPGLGLGASGANSGVLHTGFDSHPGELETALILRSALLRAELLAELGVRVSRCGARMTPRDPAEALALRELACNAARNGVEASAQADGSLLIPGESITDPVALTIALAGAARKGGAEIRTRAAVSGLEASDEGVEVTLAGGERVRAAAAVNCAGLFADEVAALAGEAPVSIYPRKGEFLVFARGPGPALGEILLPVPSAAGKGVLVFPTLDGHVIAGPTAREREDKTDWSVEPGAQELILDRALAMWPALAGAEQVGAYAGLRPAGRGANYVIERSRALPGLVHVAAIRSTGLTACLGIGEHVVGLLERDGRVAPGPLRALRVDGAPPASGPWWERAAAHWAAGPPAP